MSKTWTGGCQCGAVRYELLEKPTGAHLCHCRMCQKQFGGFYAALASVPKTKFKEPLINCCFDVRLCDGRWFAFCKRY